MVVLLLRTRLCSGLTNSGGALGWWYCLSGRAQARPVALGLGYLDEAPMSFQAQPTKAVN
jgi:hypothetical protein